MDFLATLPQPLTEPSRRFLGEWHRWRGRGLVPQRSALDTGRLGDLLLRCLLLEIRSRELIPIHFAGADVMALIGTNIAGRNYLDLTSAGNRDRRADLLLTEVGQPCAAVIYYWLQHGEGMVPVEVVSAPLCNPGETKPSLVLACASPLLKAELPAGVMEPQSYAEGEGLHFIDIGAGLPPVGPDLRVRGTLEQ
jgi:hypothetical protein